MTMLDRMRRHKNWLKWSLALVVLAFVLLYIPDFVRGPATGAGLSDAIATVDGNEVTVGEFRLAYARQMDQYRSMYGGQMDERMLRQLGIDQRVLQGLIEEEISLAEARKLGIAASDEEVKGRILAIPSFQENGQFIGYDRYRQMLQMQNPPVRESDFEEQVRRSITVEKLQAALTNWISIPDSDIDAEFRKRNEKVKLAVVNFPADKFREGLQASDDEVAAWFEKKKDTYRISEKRKVKYALLDVQAIRERTTVTPQQIQRYFDDNAQQYSTPEQVRASHVLLKMEGKNEADVKKLAEDIAAKAKGGADFAALAKQPGQVSDPVKTSFGYHVIKMVEKRPATSKPLAEVQAQIEDQLKWQGAQDEAQRIVDEISGKLKTAADLDTVAKPRGFTVAESGLFAREEPIAGLGMAPAAAEQAFTLGDGEISPAIRTPQGFVFLTVTGKQDPYVPKLEEVKPRVRDDVLKQKAIEAAQQKATAIAAQLKSGDFTATAKAAGLEAKTTDLIGRGAPIADVGVSPSVDAAAFALGAGAVSDPITTDTGAVVIKVLEKKSATPAEITAGKQQMKDELMQERRGRFYASYMGEARKRMKVQINNQLLAQL